MQDILFFKNINIVEYYERLKSQLIPIIRNNILHILKILLLLINKLLLRFSI